MKLKYLLEDVVDPSLTPEGDVHGLSLNSRSLKPGEIFLAYPGRQTDGRFYIQEALANQASVVLAEAEGLAPFVQDLNKSLPIIPVFKLCEKLGLLAQRLYQHPFIAKGVLPVTVGVTGTNGKTTCTFLLAQAAHRLGVPSAVMGTLGQGFIQHPLSDQKLTTADPITLHKQYAHLIHQGAAFIAMEVSSHGLDQDRISGLRLDSALFTNLTQDHLDYHKDMDSYLKAKLKLFTHPFLKRAIVNGDSEYKDPFISVVDQDLPLYLYSVTPPKQGRRHYPKKTVFIYAKEFALTPKGIKAELFTPWGEGVLHSPLLGQFNLSNLLAVVTELCAQGVELNAALRALQFAHGAPGRMERITRGEMPEVIIDYAHTPDALEKALQAAKQHCKRRLWCVFGCGGDRDQTKRPRMGRVAVEYADRIILTNDNPRTESPQKIIEDILSGIPLEYHSKLLIEPDRKKAITQALMNSLSVDTILIAGKGHENYQEIGQERFPFQDRQCVTEIFEQG